MYQDGVVGRVGALLARRERERERRSERHARKGREGKASPTIMKRPGTRLTRLSVLSLIKVQGGCCILATSQDTGGWFPRPHVRGTRGSARQWPKWHAAHFCQLQEERYNYCRRVEFGQADMYTRCCQVFLSPSSSGAERGMRTNTSTSFLASGDMMNALCGYRIEHPLGTFFPAPDFSPAAA